MSFSSFAELWILSSSPYALFLELSSYFICASLYFCVGNPPVFGLNEVVLWKTPFSWFIGLQSPLVSRQSLLKGVLEILGCDYWPLLALLLSRLAWLYRFFFLSREVQRTVVTGDWFWSMRISSITLSWLFSLFPFYAMLMRLQLFSDLIRPSVQLSSCWPILKLDFWEDLALSKDPD